MRKALIFGNLCNKQKKITYARFDNTQLMIQKKFLTYANDKFNFAKAPTQSSMFEILKKMNEYANTIQVKLKMKQQHTMNHLKLENTLATCLLQYRHKRICFFWSTYSSQSQKNYQPIWHFLRQTIRVIK